MVTFPVRLPKRPTEKIWLLNIIPDFVVVFAFVAAAIASLTQVLEVVTGTLQLVVLPDVPVLLATPSVNKIMLLMVLQLKFPLVSNSVSAFTIPS